MLAGELYDTMDPELVAPTVGWLAHESCSVSGEMLISVAGRVARAFVAESEGVYRPSWSIEDVAAQIEPIRRTDQPWILPPVPHGHIEHLKRSFAMAGKG